MKADERMWKIVLAGDGAVGKTSLRKTYMGEGFNETYMATMGADFAYYETTVQDTSVRWQIWDLAGQPQFKEVTRAYYTRIFGGVVVYDVTRPKTLDNIEEWVNDLWSNSDRDRKVPVILLGNKIDLRGEIEGIISTNEGKKKAKQLGITRFVETSAKTGDGINIAFEQLGKDILEYTRE